jgi:hypothetical protein
MKTIASLTLLAFAALAPAQDSLMQRMVQIEANNGVIAERLSRLENKVDLIGSKLDSHLAALKTRTVTSGTNGTVGTVETGQWVCDPMGVCRWVPGQTAQTLPSGYEWQWIQGQAMMVPVGWCSCPTCQSNYGIGRYTGYSCSSCSSFSSIDVSGGSRGKCGPIRRLLGRCK